MPRLAIRLTVASILLGLLAFAGSRVPPPRAEDDLARTIHYHLVADGGCTIDPRTGKAVGQVDAYAVSLAGYEREFIAPPSADAIREYLRRHASIFTRRPRIFVGAWQDNHTGRCYLDLTELIPDRTTALAQGRANDQRCIYHLSTSQEVYLQREDRLSSRVSTARPIRR